MSTHEVYPTCLPHTFITNTGVRLVKADDHLTEELDLSIHMSTQMSMHSHQKELQHMYPHVHAHVSTHHRPAGCPAWPTNMPTLMSTLTHQMFRPLRYESLSDLKFCAHHEAGLVEANDHLAEELDLRKRAIFERLEHLSYSYGLYSYGLYSYAR